MSGIDDVDDEAVDVAVAVVVVAVVDVVELSDVDDDDVDDDDDVSTDDDSSLITDDGGGGVSSNSYESQSRGEESSNCTSRLDSTDNAIDFYICLVFSIDEQKYRIITFCCSGCR